MDPLSVSIIAAAFSVWAGGSYVASLGKGGHGVMIVLSVVLLGVAFFSLLWRASQAL